MVQPLRYWQIWWATGPWADLPEALAPAGAACEGPLPVALGKAGQLTAATTKEAAGEAAGEAACQLCNLCLGQPGAAVIWAAVVAAPATLF